MQGAGVTRFHDLVEGVELGRDLGGLLALDRFEDVLVHEVCHDTRHLRFGVQGSGFRVQGSGFRVQGSGFRDLGGLLVLDRFEDVLVHQVRRHARDLRFSI